MQLNRLLLPGSALLSLAFVGHFLIGLRAADAGNHPIFVANQAIANRVKSAAEYAPPATVSDIVTKALTFKAMLTTAQQATLEQAYTPTLARKWSNLPCANTCRNGIGLGTLTADQLTAALAVIQAATNTAANEGYDEFQQIRMADDVLAAASGGSGGGPGGLSYDSGNYYLSFLNTPSTTGAWMMQFGGHHYAANISFNGGHIVSTTPHFYGLEPLSFTVNRTTYAPLTQEHDAMANMLASLTASQLTAAKLSQTFSDAVMIPGETQGGTGTFPATKIGVPVSSLSAAQKQLVFEAMKPWVQDMEATVAANLLAAYQSELDQTYVAYTGSGVSGDASTFLNANTNYARIDGPGVWIEFVCQSGVVYRNQIHYHTVWRDHIRDYAKDLTLTTPLDAADGGTPSTVGAVTSTSAASYAAGTLAPEAIGTLFGANLASTTAVASTTPLPTKLGGVELQVKDSNGITRSAPLFYVSPTQISYQLPAETGTGSATLTVMLNGTAVGQGTTTVEQVTPGLFAANANGQGVAAAIALRVKADGSQIAENVLQLNASTNRYEALPIAAAGTGEQLFLLLFGTGFRNRTSLANVTASVGGTVAEVTYAGLQGLFVGLDQANVRLPALAGKGEVNVTLTVDGKTSNVVTVNLK